MIRLANVVKTFNSGKPNQFTAVDDVSIEIRPLNLTVLKGPSGSGKTTLLSLIGCMVRPSSGRIFLHGIETRFARHNESAGSFEITSLPERFLNEIRRSTFGFIFQQFNLIKGISVLENIMLPAYPTGENHTALHQRGMGLLERFDIKRHAPSKVEWLSGGELQRVAIARALINNPSILVADEPTAHLDSRLSHEFMKIVSELKSKGKTILIASHDPIVYDSEIADTVVEMRDGRITGRGHEE
ncbi:putative ABC transporter ATP-binding protein [Geobacter sp. OR-1]|uniref:ABC transporter ATP-binding protein n=1 Tax=Geobacter sp. OR-1 TaxID=1266765 RepID=UPI0005438472|nr:ABC transporter ATP-binding protein [Geobacter sp. OR-1]GAM10074.1 putative ABC transporter ATP-binding protein [Geobacter sp. OR-1]